MAKFQNKDQYHKDNLQYNFLPFRFSDFDKNSKILSNMIGEFQLLPNSVFKDFVNKDLLDNNPFYSELRDKHFFTDTNTSVALDLLPIKIRTKYQMLSNFTALHIFVVSLRCEHSCPYCQVSRQSEDKNTFDMDEDKAEKALNLVFQSPSQNIKIEFQGGEPLLNFELIKFIVLKAIEIKPNEKNVSFVIATNLALINEKILEFCSRYNILISTSLDGPKEIHNKNRPRKGNNSYEKTIEGINLSRNYLGLDAVSALMTTTYDSLPKVKEIIDEYIKNKFSGIFLRPLSPHGFAIKTKSYSKYRFDEWLDFYKKGLDYIIFLNKNGIEFFEHFTQVILKKMLTSDSDGYVDLMNPSGLGIAVAVYNYDGKIYASDEGRMLAETGDDYFCIGSVEDKYSDIFSSEKLLNILDDTFTKSAPLCSDCVYEEYCGADPVFHYATQKDIVGHKPTSEFCNRNIEIFKHLIMLMNESKYVEKLFRSWVR